MLQTGIRERYAAWVKKWLLHMENKLCPGMSGEGHPKWENVYDLAGSAAALNAPSLLLLARLPFLLHLVQRGAVNLA